MLRRASALNGCDPRLITLAQDVGSQRSVIALCGPRSLADEIKAIQTHHSELKDPMNSKHVVDPQRRPLALAMDIGPWPLDWNNKQSFIDLATFVKSRAQALGIPIRWGGEWGDDDHFELV
jgi:peptidoglycan LD-endopeptidase CwlK